MKTLEEELSGKFGRPIKKEDVWLGLDGAVVGG